MSYEQGDRIDFIHNKIYTENISTMKLKLQNEAEQKITNSL